MCINIIPTAPWSPWRNEEQQPLHRLQCELGRRVVEARTAHVSAQGIEDRGHRSRWPFAWLQRNFHCAIYNIKTQEAVWNSRRLRKRLGSRALEFLFPSPAPPRKKSTTHPKCLPIKSPITRALPGIDPIGKPPSANPVHRTHAKDSHPKPANDNALTPSRTRMSSPLAIAREQRRARSNKLPRRNATATCARAMGQDYPSTGPSPGAKPPIYPSSLPLACGNLLSNIFSKSHGIFSF